MTKARTPDSIEDAAMIAAALLGPDRMGQIADGVSASAVRNWNDPDRPGRPTIHQAIKVDAACAKHPGGQGVTPFFTAYKRRLDAVTGERVVGADLMTEALDVPAAVGHLMETLSQARSAASANGKAISPSEDRGLRRDLKEIRDELDQFEASLDCERGAT